MIRWAIDRARISREEPAAHGEEWWVWHPNGKAVLAYCDTEREARRCLEAIGAAMRSFPLDGGLHKKES